MLVMINNYVCIAHKVVKMVMLNAIASWGLQIPKVKVLVLMKSLES